MNYGCHMEFSDEVMTTSRQKVNDEGAAALQPSMPTCYCVHGAVDHRRNRSPWNVRHVIRTVSFCPVCLSIPKKKSNGRLQPHFGWDDVAADERATAQSLQFTDWIIILHNNTHSSIYSDKVQTLLSALSSLHCVLSCRSSWGDEEPLIIKIMAAVK